MARPWFPVHRRQFRAVGDEEGGSDQSFHSLVDPELVSEGTVASLSRTVSLLNMMGFSVLCSLLYSLMSLVRVILVVL